MVKTRGHHDKTLLHHLTATTVDLEIQRAREPEHQLGVVMAVDDQVVAVLAQREDRSHRGLPGKAHGARASPLPQVTGLPVYTGSAMARAVTGLTRHCHGQLTGPAQACKNIAEGRP